MPSETLQAKNWAFVFRSSLPAPEPWGSLSQVSYMVYQEMVPTTTTSPPYFFQGYLQLHEKMALAPLKALLDDSTLLLWIACCSPEMNIAFCTKKHSKSFTFGTPTLTPKAPRNDLVRVGRGFKGRYRQTKLMFQPLTLPNPKT